MVNGFSSFSPVDRDLGIATRQRQVSMPILSSFSPVDRDLGIATTPNQMEIHAQPSFSPVDRDLGIATWMVPALSCQSALVSVP